MSTRPLRRGGAVLAACVAVCVLGACGGSDDEALRRWVAAQRVQTGSALSPITEPRRFLPQPYADTERLDPFDVQKLARSLRRDVAQPQSSALIDAELSRRKEVLESFPLDAMAMVGSMRRRDQPVALVSADKRLYPVRVGSHLGLNHGRVVRITESEVALREVVQDAAGEWVERMAMLQLQDRSK